MKTLIKNWRDHGGQAHEHTHGNKIEIFWRIRPSFSIRREWMYVSTRQRWRLNYQYIAVWLTSDAKEYKSYYLVFWIFFLYYSLAEWSTCLITNNEVAGSISDFICGLGLECGPPSLVRTIVTLSCHTAICQSVVGVLLTSLAPFGVNATDLFIFVYSVPKMIDVIFCEIYKL